MGRKYETLADSVVAFIEEQAMFFVATAPLREDGHVNVSPKGADSLRVIDNTTIIYADLTGSAAETIAHLRDNGRITIMWCSFGPKPRILRVYSQGEHLLPSHPEFAELSELFPDFKALRSIVRLRTGRIADSCGYGVPEMDLVGPRSKMAEWADRKSPAELEEYRHTNNEVSIDGLPAWEG
ncbi:MAG: pyridoxamine 5'-phosphate oxidase family protein [bacterium]|nr:pyridoxamine 5'-phosphate oxidase family protein [bacterium]